MTSEQKRDRRLNVLVTVSAGFAAVMVLMAAVFGPKLVSAASTTEEQRCLQSINVGLFVATIRTLGIDPGERDALVVRLVAQAEAIDRGLRGGEDPCDLELELPAVFEE